MEDVSPESNTPSLYTVSSRPASRDPVFWKWPWKGAINTLGKTSYPLIRVIRFIRMMPGMPILYGLTDLTDLRITMVKQEGCSASPEANQAKL